MYLVFSLNLLRGFVEEIPSNNIYPNGVLMIPFATKTINVTGMLTASKIPTKTKLSLLSMVHQRYLLFV